MVLVQKVQMVRGSRRLRLAGANPMNLVNPLNLNPEPDEPLNQMNQRNQS